MYRIVTKTMRQYKGTWQQVIDAGPWHPVEGHALQWANYLAATGLYDSVEIESNLRDSAGGRRYQV